ncbi:MAG: class I SAM-dependent methyltransferase [Coprococcus sp.]
MGVLLKAIEHYWTNRAEGYSQVNLEELAGQQWPVWLSVIEKYMPDKDTQNIRILDIGTGPGFFSIILARAGYQVTAVDYTEEMLCKARQNAGHFADAITWRRMDAQKLDFEDESFDMVVSRNVTWNLEHPEQAYSEWMRVLKPGGRLLNFDANWYHQLFDEEKRAAYEADRARVSELGIQDDYTCTDIEAMEAIARQVPLSRIQRPEWDYNTLRSLNAIQIEADREIWRKVWCEAEKINYASTPMFMVSCVKAPRQERERYRLRAAMA